MDLFAAKTDFESEVIASAREGRVLSKPIRLARPEASIIYKLLAARAKDIADVESIFEARRAARDALDWDFLDAWASAWGIDGRLAEYRTRFGPNAR